MPGDRKLGRLPRERDPAVPHLSALLAGKVLPAPPPAADYVVMLPQAPYGLGMMLNDKLGDCTCAAFHHARMIWSYQNISPPHGEVPPEWTIAPGDVKMLGGHAIVAGGYDADHLYIVSWGALFRMRWDFFAKYADEVYAASDRA